MSNKYRLLLVASLMGSLVLAIPALAQNNNTDKPGMGFGRMGRMMGWSQNGIIGTVVTINGNILTISSKIGPKISPTTTYTVDATNAKVTKNGKASTVANIAVGDILMIQGVMNETNIAATTIRDNVPQKPEKEKPVIQGNGQPVIAGTVNAINGNTLTVKNTNVTYTVDATNVKITNVAVGDSVIVQGTVNGTNIVATSIIDHTEQHHGFFGDIGNFFKHLFGF